MEHFWSWDLIHLYLKLQEEIYNNTHVNHKRTGRTMREHIIYQDIQKNYMTTTLTVQMQFPKRFMSFSNGTQYLIAGDKSITLCMERLAKPCLLSICLWDLTIKSEDTSWFSQNVRGQPHSSMAKSFLPCSIKIWSVILKEMSFEDFTLLYRYLCLQHLKLFKPKFISILQVNRN